jgi:nitrile hydratase
VVASDTGRFKPGDRVRVRQENPEGNPRTPVYIRGKQGVVSLVHGQMENPLDHHDVYPPMYTVAFKVGEVFANGSPESLHLELHEDWLEPAG